ncbi:MAG: type II secretion system protein GspK [Candidatus Aenigmatarchaeota archaeon]
MNKNKGSAIILTLLIVSVIFTIAIGFNWYVKEYMKNAEALRKKTEAMLKTYSTFDILTYVILTGLVTNKEILVPSDFSEKIKLRTIPLDGRDFNFIYDDIIVKIFDTNGLISLNPINEDAFKRLIKKFSNHTPETLLECYYDWVDTDSLRRVLGAEAEDYQRWGIPFRPRNYPLQYKRELSLIAHFDQKLFYKISPYITLLPISGFNPNTAPIEVLMAVLDIDEATARKLKNHIENIRPIKSEEELSLLIGKTVILGEEYDFKPSGYFEITIRNIENGDIIYEILAGLRKLGNQFSPYVITHWNEE